MKQIKLILIILIVSLSACDKNFLDRDPVNIMSADQVFSTPDAVEAYFVSIYAALPMEDFNYQSNRFNLLSDFTMEALNSTKYGSSLAPWSKFYLNLWPINNFLEQVSTVNIPESQKKVYIAEAMFCRAFQYAEMAKLFGGVPILLKNQIYNGGNTESLNLPRNTEEEVWRQVKSDLEYAAENLPEISVYGRANKYVAYALLSRSMLYAGSIAKFGTLGVDGLTGIPSSKADEFLLSAYNAAKKVITSNKYKLFNNYPTDKAKNYQLLFIEPANNPEVILSRGFDYNASKKTHNYDMWNLPNVIKSPSGFGNSQIPTLDMIERFQYIDGSPGTLKIGNGTATNPAGYIRYTKPEDLFTNKDPRFFGTFITNFSYFKDVQITCQRGVIYKTKEYSGNNFGQYFDLTTLKITAQPTANSVPATGNSGSDGRFCWAKKWMDPTKPQPLCGPNSSDIDWIELRYAETLLDFAEAAFETNQPGTEALNAINQLHTRAGIALYTTIDRQKIRDERFVELCFENKIFWDFRRWRTLTTYFNMWQPYSVYMFYDIDKGNYVFRRQVDGTAKTYIEKQYYDIIPVSEMSTNPLLKQNPGY